MHLRPDEFIDVVEGTRPESSLPHLAACRECRDELEVLRATMYAAGVEADVPEPSPLFWERLSSDVRGRIDAEAAPRAWWMAWLRPPVLVPVSALAAIAIVIAVAFAPSTRVTTSVATTASSIPVAGSPTAVEPAGDAGDLNDPMLMLVNDLSAGMDLDAAADAGFASPDAAEYALTHMNAEDLRTLRRLLQAEMARPGA